MMRRALLWLSEQPRIFRFVRRNRLARRFASRFVAGEEVVEGVAAARELEARAIRVSLDLLGESVTAPALAKAACDRYVEMQDAMRAAGVEVNVSVKLTQMGFDIDEALCLANLRRILERARRHGGFVRLDMESSAYTQRTLDFFEHRLYPEYGGHVGVVIQSALRRSAADVEHLIGLKARVRLCKGAYLESSDVAFPDKRDVDAQYVALMKRLMAAGNFPGLATHDEAIIREAEAFARAEGIPAGRFEFQMLYGVRRDLQDRLRAAGWGMRVYVPFGTQWYPYLMRRLAERPANIWFILGNIIREGLSPRR